MNDYEKFVDKYTQILANRPFGFVMYFLCRTVINMAWILITKFPDEKSALEDAMSTLNYKS